MEDCPPPLVSFEMDRSTTDGVTTSVGWEWTPTRQVHAKYRDNRTNHDKVAWLEGEANLTNWRTKASVVRYRHAVPLEFWLVPKIPEDSPACYDAGKIVGFWEVRLHPAESVTIDIGWSVDLYDRADFNQDGVVDAEDLALLLAAWGRYHVPEDLDQDGVVDGYDLGWFFTRWSER